MLVGLLAGAFVGWPTSSLYERGMTESTAVALVPRPAYVLVGSVDGRADGDRDESVVEVEGSPSKHIRHGTTHSSYLAGKGLLGRTSSSRVYNPCRLWPGAGRGPAVRKGLSLGRHFPVLRVPLRHSPVFRQIIPPSQYKWRW